MTRTGEYLGKLFAHMGKECYICLLYTSLMMKSIMIMTIHHQVHTRHIAVHRIIQAAAQEAAVIHQRVILPENIIVRCV